MLASILLHCFIESKSLLYLLHLLGFLSRNILKKRKLCPQNPCFIKQEEEGCQGILTNTYDTVIPLSS